MRKRIQPYFLIFLISVVPLFYHLGSYPIQLWDESRMAHSAYDMHTSGYSLIPLFNGGSDLWNTKPPLLIWFQTTSMKLFGVTEFSIRLPSALAGLGTLFFLLGWVRKQGYEVVTGMLASVILLLSSGYVDWHCTRTGDYDALMIFFMVIQVMYFYLYVTESESAKSQKYLTICLIATVLGVWTKGINSLFFVPMLAVWWFALKKWRGERQSRFVLKIVFALLASVSYYIIRELIEPGYLPWVQQNELGGRFFHGLENHEARPDFYLNLFTSQTGNWLYAAIPAVLTALLIGDKKDRQLLFYLLSNATMFYAVIHFAQTKNIWYHLPLFPLLAMTLAVSTEVIIRYILNLFGWQKRLSLAIILMTFLLFSGSYIKLVDKTLNQTEYVENKHNFYEVTNYLRHQLGGEIKRKWTFIDMEYSAHNWWYIRRLNTEGHQIKSFIHLDSIHVGDVLLFNQQHVYDSISRTYSLEKLHRSDAFHLVRLREKSPGYLRDLSD